jgi:hypothetical protein
MELARPHPCSLSATYVGNLGLFTSTPALHCLQQKKHTFPFNAALMLTTSHARAQGQVGSSYQRNLWHEYDLNALPGTLKLQGFGGKVSRQLG